MEKYSSFSATVGDLLFKLPPLGIGSVCTSKTATTHVHGTFELHVVFDEAMLYEIDNNIVTLTPGDFLLIFPNVTHRQKPVDKPVTRYSFRFSVEKSSKHSDTDYYSLFSAYGEKWLCANGPLITEYIKKILNFINTEPLFSADKIKAYLILLFTEMLTPFFKEGTDVAKISQTTSEYDSIVNQISTYFSVHYAEDITLSQLATKLHLSTKQTQHIIKKAFSATFRECLSKIRLKNAKDLLAETDYDIKTIAESVGYQSYNGFYLAFKAKFGITPIEYRNIKQADKA